MMQDVKAYRWTESAIDCYRLGCNCSRCPTYQLITHQKCRMKYTVIALVRDIGVPDVPENE